MKGTMVVGGQRFEIVDVFFEKGVTRVIAILKGPCSAGRGVPTIFGVDGRGVFQGDALIEWPKLPRFQDVRVTYDITTLFIESRRVGQSVGS